jgi:hypothetical protein
MRHQWSSIGCSTLLVTMSVCTTAPAQCVVIDFDDLTPGTTVTNQIPGVVFSAVPGSCGGQGSVLPVIVTPPSGTSSGARALGIQTGCPSFSPDYLRMVFDVPQRIITFTLGEETVSTTTFDVRWYTAAGGLLGTQSITTGPGVHRLVTVGSTDGAANIARVEVDSPISFFEAIDDVRYGFDDTPPTAILTEPSPTNCSCESELLVFRGLACDDDGQYQADMLEYRPADAAPSDPWMVAATAASPLCTVGSLYVLDVEGIGITGETDFRLTVTNACGLTSSATVRINLDNQFDTVDVASPQNLDTICGEVAITGTADDANGLCFDNYSVTFAPAGSGDFMPVDPGNPIFTNRVVNGTLATWDTTEVADGNYVIRLTGADLCGNASAMNVNVTVDNAGDCRCAADIVPNGMVDVNDFFFLLQHWGACP